MFALVGSWFAAPENAPFFSYATGTALALAGALIGTVHVLRRR